MKLLILIMTLTIIASVSTIAWAAGLDPRAVDIEVWWNLGLLVTAALIVGAARLRLLPKP